MDEVLVSVVEDTEGTLVPLFFCVNIFIITMISIIARIIKMAV